MEGGALMPKSLSERVLLRKNIFIEAEVNQQDVDGDQDQEEAKMADGAAAPRGEMEPNNHEPSNKYRQPEHELMDRYDEYEDIEIKRSDQSSRDANQEDAERVLQMLKERRNMEKSGGDQYTDEMDEDDDEIQIVDNAHLDKADMQMRAGQ